MGRFQTFQTGFDVQKKVEEFLRHTVMVLMMDEFEILCWVNYVDQINLLDLCYNVDNPRQILQTAENTIFNLAFSTKNLLNEKKIKEPI